MNQVFAVRQLSEKYPIANGKDVVWAFMDFEKANDVADAKSVCSLRRIVDGCEEFLCSL